MPPPPIPVGTFSPPGPPGLTDPRPLHRETSGPQGSYQSGCWASVPQATVTRRLSPAPHAPPQLLRARPRPTRPFPAMVGSILTPQGSKHAALSTFLRGSAASDSWETQTAKGL